MHTIVIILSTASMEKIVKTILYLHHEQFVKATPKCMQSQDSELLEDILPTPLSI